MMNIFGLDLIVSEASVSCVILVLRKEISRRFTEVFVADECVNARTFWKYFQNEYAFISCSRVIRTRVSQDAKTVEMVKPFVIYNYYSILRTLRNNG